MLDVLILSPNPSDNAGGVERFCNHLRSAAETLGLSATISSTAVNDASIVVSNGYVGATTDRPRIHVYHGTWVEHVRHGEPTASLPWKLRSVAKFGWRERQAGLGATTVAVSRPTAKELAKWYGMHVDHVIPNGVDTSVFAPQSRLGARSTLGWSGSDRISLFIGRPEGRKRPKLATSVADAVSSQLFMAGVPSEFGHRQLGVLSEPQLAIALAAADLVVMPTSYEACSYALLEAWAVGTPVVTTRVGWTLDLIDAVPAYAQLTAPRDDHEGLVRAARVALSGDGSMIAELVRQFVTKKRSLDAFTAQWGSVFKELGLVGESDDD